MVDYCDIVRLRILGQIHRNLMFIINIYMISGTVCSIFCTNGTIICYCNVFSCFICFSCFYIIRLSINSESCYFSASIFNCPNNRACLKCLRIFSNCNSY